MSTHNEKNIAATENSIDVNGYPCGRVKIFVSSKEFFD
jgi:hypothetical protein